MKLWVRSQDKEKLCKIHDLCVRENQNENNETNYVIQDIYTMGTYKTKERALKVLDEIQKIIKWCQRDMKDVTVGDMEDLNGCFDDYVYEMPKE